MKKTLFVLMNTVCILFAANLYAQSDKAGCNDNPLFPTRMPEYRIEACKVEDFGVYEFSSVKGPKIPSPLCGGELQCY